MQRLAVLVLVVAALAAGCGGGDDGEEATATTAAPTSTAAPGTSVVEMSIPDTTVASDGPVAGAGSGTVIMLKLHVDDIDEGASFYETVFGATVAYELGDGIRVLTMPDGPGMILIEDDPAEADAWNGSFLVQVPDLQAAQAQAVENGAEVQQAFEGAPGGEQARSVDLLDPWGNQVEILQLG